MKRIKAITRGTLNEEEKKSERFHRSIHATTFGDKIRMNVQSDRLSNLSDDLIHNILFFISVRQAIETSVLSSRWRFIWTSMHCLNFSRGDLTPKFVSNVLSRSNSQIRVSSVKLGLYIDSDEVVERILMYTSFHHAQQLTVICDSEFRFPLNFFCSQSLKHLSLSGANGPYSPSSHFFATSSCYLPSLTTLHLDHVRLSEWYQSDDQCIGLFSKCANLKNLSLSACEVSEKTVLNICHPGLSNLSIIRCYGNYLISAPGVTSLVIKIKGSDPLQLSTHGLCSLEKLDLCIFRPLLADSHKILSLLQELQSVKYLTLNLEILEFFSHSIRRISGQASPFVNFEIVEFVTSYPARVCMRVRGHKKITTCKVKNYQLDSSSSSVFPKVSFEEIKVMKDIVCTQRLIAESRVLLEQYETKKGRMVHANAPKKIGKAQVKKQCPQSAFELQWHFGEMMAMIKQRKSEGLLTNLPTTQICHMISWLQRIESSLTRLHASKRGPMQPAFSSVCEEAAFVANTMLDCKKIRYTKKPKHDGKTATNGVLIAKDGKASWSRGELHCLR